MQPRPRAPSPLASARHRASLDRHRHGLLADAAVAAASAPPKRFLADEVQLHPVVAVPVVQSCPPFVIARKDAHAVRLGVVWLTLRPVFGDVPRQEMAGLPDPVAILLDIGQADPVGRRVVQPAIQLWNKLCEEVYKIMR